MSKLVEESVDVDHKTPQEKLDSLKNQELELKEQIKQPDSFLRNLYSSPAPKKDVIALWADNLEEQYALEKTLGYTTTVTSIGHISAYIKSQLRHLGVHESTFSYVHEVLGYKYKNENKNRYQSESDDEDLRGSASQTSSIPIADFDQENESLIQTINSQIEFLKNLRTKARSSHILTILNDKQRLQYEETNFRVQATQLLADQLIDDRQSVPMNAQLKLIMAVVAQTNNFAAGMYVSQIKQFGANKMQESRRFFKKGSEPIIQTLSKKNQKLYNTTLQNIKTLRKEFYNMQRRSKAGPSRLADVMTSKQAMKIVFGVVKRVLAVFDHTSRDEAILDGFYGLQCPECGSFRVKEKEHPDSHEWLCFCYKCEWWFEARTVVKCWHCHIPLFEDILKVVLKSATPVLDKYQKETGAMDSSCPRCEEKLVLPAKMFKKPLLRGR